MKKKINRSLIAGGLMAALVVSTMAGCGNTAETTTAGSGTDTENSTVSEDNSSNEFVLNDDGSFVSGGIQFPLEEKLTFTWWQTADATVQEQTQGDINNNTFFQEFERLTNIHFEFITPAQGTEQENYNLTIASGELPDIMSNPSYYTDGIDSGIEDGYFMDLTDLIPTYMPEYYALLEEDDCVKDVTGDSGKIGTLGYIWTHQQAPVAGYIVRQDWLDDLGLDTPVTYDDWEVMLTRFKEEEGAEYPLSMNKFFLWALGYGYGAYGSSTEVCYRDGDEIKVSLVDNSEGCKKYFETLHDWYEKGLIDPNFMSDTGIFPDTTLMTTGSSGVIIGMYSSMSTSLAPITEAGGSLSGIQVPVENEGDTLMASPSSIYYVAAGKNLTISADCENAEILLAAFNYLFTEPGMMLANYGIEGDTYNVEDGEIVYTDKMLENIGNSVRKYTLPPSWAPALVEPDRQNCAMSEASLAAQEAWESGYDALLPTLSYTAEENQELASIQADLLTYIEETTLKFVTGAESLDNWDEFVETCKSMNIERVGEIKQAAYDRYISK